MTKCAHESNQVEDTNDGSTTHALADDTPPIQNDTTPFSIAGREDTDCAIEVVNNAFKTSGTQVHHVTLIQIYHNRQ